MLFLFFASQPLLSAKDPMALDKQDEGTWPFWVFSSCWFAKQPNPWLGMAESGDVPKPRATIGAFGLERAPDLLVFEEPWQFYGMRLQQEPGFGDLLDVFLFSLFVPSGLSLPFRGSTRHGQNRQLSWQADCWGLWNLLFFFIKSGKASGRSTYMRLIFLHLGPPLCELQFPTKHLTLFVWMIICRYAYAVCGDRCSYWHRISAPLFLVSKDVNTEFINLILWYCKASTSGKHVHTSSRPYTWWELCCLQENTVNLNLKIFLPLCYLNVCFLQE